MGLHRASPAKVDVQETQAEEEITEEDAEIAANTANTNMESYGTCAVALYDYEVSHSWCGSNVFHCVYILFRQPMRQKYPLTLAKSSRILTRSTQAGGKDWDLMVRKSLENNSFLSFYSFLGNYGLFPAHNCARVGSLMK